MLFWILAALVVATLITVIKLNAWDGVAYSIFLGFIAFLLSGLLAFGIWGVACWLIPKERVVTETTTYQLRALGNDSALTGRSYFLGGGYVNDKRVLNYITRDDSGAIKVDRAYADDSTIYEGADTATLKVTHVDEVNGWVSPWPVSHKHLYEFNIPTGSVVESYALDNK